MSETEILVAVFGVGVIGVIGYYFFGPKNDSKEAVVENEVQRVEIVVDAAYMPSEVGLKVGVPAEISFDRRDKGECTEWVIMKLPHSKGKEVKSRLSEGKVTKVVFTPTQKGRFNFSCGMGMVHGKLIIE